MRKATAVHGVGDEGLFAVPCEFASLRPFATGFSFLPIKQPALRASR